MKIFIVLLLRVFATCLSFAGNGTQNIFNNRDEVAFISSHVVNDGFYPMTGFNGTLKKAL